MVTPTIVPETGGGSYGEGSSIVNGSQTGGGGLQANMQQQSNQGGNEAFSDNVQQQGLGQGQSQIQGQSQAQGQQGQGGQQNQQFNENLNQQQSQLNNINQGGDEEFWRYVEGH